MLLSVKQIAEKFESGVKILETDGIYKVFKYLRTYDLTYFNSIQPTHTGAGKKIKHLKHILINRQNVKDCEFSYELTHGLHLFTDNSHNILYEKTIDKCRNNITFLLRHHIETKLISDYIIFLESLERKEKIKQLSDIWIQ